MQISSPNRSFSPAQATAQAQVPVEARGNVDYYLKLDGIEGESHDSKHKGWIDIQSFSWGATQSGHAPGGGSSAGKVAVTDLMLMAYQCKASPKVMVACANGDHVKSAIIEAVKAGTDSQAYMKLTLSDCLVSSYQVSASGEALVPIESFSLNFGKLEFEYKPQKPDGSLDAALKSGWDVKANKKV
jgi:type VI secretion system secreted protein Hcp